MSPQQQGDLFSEDIRKTEELCPELLEDLRIITGGFNPFGNSEEPQGAGADDEGHPVFRTAQQKFLDSRSKIKIVCSYEDPQVHVLDLNKPEDQETYKKIIAEIAPQVSNDPKGWVYDATPFQTIIDPNAAAGFRVVTIIRYWKVKKTKEQEESGFHIVQPK